MDARWSRPLVLAALLVPALFLRVLSFTANDTPHGDVAFSAIMTETLADGGGFVFPAKWLRPYSTAAFDGGMPMDGQPPLWPLAAVPVHALISDGYTSLKVLSMVAGVLLLPAAFVTFRRHFGRDAAGVATLATGYSVVMIDYSGNGSLYSLLALLFVGFVHGLSAPLTLRRGIALGLLAGGGLLLHQGALVLLLALLLRAARDARAGSPRGPVIGAVSTALVLAGAVLAPWWIRNAQVFGDPFFQSHHLFVLHEMGVPWRLVDLGSHDLVVAFDLERFGRWQAVRTMAVWFVENAGFLAMKLLVLTPVLALLATIPATRALATGWSTRHRLADPWTAGLVLVPLGYAALACAWPIFQFRCLVVVLPFVAALGAAAIAHVGRPGMRALLGAVALAGVLIPGLVEISRVPSRTYYYSDWEPTFQAKEAELREVSDRLASMPPGPVLSHEFNVHYYTRLPWTYLPPDLPLDDLGTFVAANDTRYILTTPGAADAYRTVLETTSRHDGEFFALIECAPPSPQAD